MTNDSRAENEYPAPEDASGFVAEAMAPEGEVTGRSRSRAALQEIKVLFRELHAEDRQELESFMKQLRREEQHSEDQEEFTQDELNAIRAGLAELDRGESVADAEVWSRVGL